MGENVTYEAIDYLTKLYSDLSVVVISSLIFFVILNLVRKNFNLDDGKIDKVIQNSVVFAIFVIGLESFVIIIRSYFGF